MGMEEEKERDSKNYNDRIGESLLLLGEEEEVGVVKKKWIDDENGKEGKEEEGGKDCDWQWMRYMIMRDSDGNEKEGNGINRGRVKRWRDIVIGNHSNERVSNGIKRR